MVLDILENLLCQLVVLQRFSNFVFENVVLYPYGEVELSVERHVPLLILPEDSMTDDCFVLQIIGSSTESVRFGVL